MGAKEGPRVVFDEFPTPKQVVEPSEFNSTQKAESGNDNIAGGLIPPSRCRCKKCQIFSDVVDPIFQNRCIAMNEAIFTSTQHNFDGLKLPVYSNIKVEFFKQNLGGSSYKDSDLCGI